MKRKLLILTLLLTSASLGLPVEAYSSTPKERAVTEYSGGQDWRWERRRRRGRSRGWKNTWGYRNYGQYRRTQVGNRRYRLVRRYYWDDGRRFTRWVRIYY